jgi:hypothetical protein
MIKPSGDFAGDFDVGCLIYTDGHTVGAA